VHGYTVFATVAQKRSYNVEAQNMEEAIELVREEYNYLEYDIIDDEIDDVTVEE
jgi:hypothetical protein